METERLLTYFSPREERMLGYVRAALQSEFPGIQFGEVRRDDGTYAVVLDSPSGQIDRAIRFSLEQHGDYWEFHEHYPNGGRALLTQGLDVFSTIAQALRVVTNAKEKCHGGLQKAGEPVLVFRHDAPGAASSPVHQAPA